MVEGSALGGAALDGSRPVMLVTIEWRLERPRVARVWVEDRGTPVLFWVLGAAPWGSPGC